MTPICEMCIYLHLEDYFGIQKKIINDLSKFASINENCKFLYY